MTPLPNLGSSPAGGEGAPRFSLSTCPISGSHLAFSRVCRTVCARAAL